MRKQQINLLYALTGVSLLILAAWAHFNDQPWLMFLCVPVGGYMVLKAVRWEPEIIEADQEAQRVQWRILPPLIASSIAGVFISKIEGFEWVRVWVVLPVAVIAVVWFVLVWPFVLIMRADRQVQERKQRDGD